MRRLALLAAVTLAASPAWAQANANLAPGGIVDGAKAGINDAEGTAPDGRQGEGQQAATSGSKMVKQGATGAQPAAKAEAPDRP